ncbi:MAG TPA: hypothetical protein VG937_33185 [Polyangiaceae bacterium]|nr:hypothetical protein [Polyangiaceae bacterium]
MRNVLTLRGPMPSSKGPGRVLLVYTGAGMASIEQPLGATLVAPNAKVELKSVANPGHGGAVFAKQVELHQNTTFTQVGFQGGWRP